jgi:hypothetical protein
MATGKPKPKPKVHKPPREPQIAITGLEPLIPFPPPAAPAAYAPPTQPPLNAAAELLLSRHMNAHTPGAAGAAAAGAAPKLEDESAAGPSGTPEGAPATGEDGVVAPPVATPGPEYMIDAGEAGETSTKYTGVRRNKGGRFSARIKIAGTNKCAACTCHET